jgi:hypothetical protein
MFPETGGRFGVRAFKLVGALLPVVYCGGLVYFFMSHNDLSDASTAEGLGPTVIGLGAIGLLFCIPVIYSLIKMMVRPRDPAPKSDADADTPEAGSGFDADAALARYLARKAAAGQADGFGEAVPTQPTFDGPRPSFGRKVG